MSTRLTVEELKKLIIYDPLTGNFYSKNNKNNNKNGEKIGSVSSNGYLNIAIHRRSYLAHRLAWFYMKGYWPKQIDHKDGNVLNNIFSNLRETDKYGNAQNRKKPSHGKNKYKGVTFYSKNNKWGARITFQGNRILIGLFDSPEEANEAYISKAKELFKDFYNER